MLTASYDSSFKIWDLKENSGVPTDTFYEFENQIVSGDLNGEGIVGLLDKEGDVYIMTKGEKKGKKIKLKKGNYSRFRFDRLDNNKFAVYGDDYVKVYDLRKNLEVYSQEMISGSEFYLEGEQVLWVENNVINLNSGKDVVKQWKFEQAVTAFERSEEEGLNLLAGFNDGSLALSIINVYGDESTCRPPTHHHLQLFFVSLRAAC